MLNQIEYSVCLMMLNQLLEAKKITKKEYEKVKISLMKEYQISSEILSG
ncbi:SHOCT domain-containing protein [Erysipelothrix rhusiopathiae]|nr:SHOCT domain-containing protein [Erysipelothrix rhusiopathiae]AYV35229.1 conjugal transfer protein [Erysipelothrix rhusiopathiae]